MRPCIGCRLADQRPDVWSAVRQQDADDAEHCSDGGVTGEADGGEGDGLSEGGDGASGLAELLAEHVAESWCQQDDEEQQPDEGCWHLASRLLLLARRWRRRWRPFLLGRAHGLGRADLTVSFPIVLAVPRPATQVASLFSVGHHHLLAGRAWLEQPEHIVPVRRITFPIDLHWTAVDYLLLGRASAGSSSRSSSGYGSRLTPRSQSAGSNGSEAAGWNTADGPYARNEVQFAHWLSDSHTIAALQPTWISRWRARHRTATPTCAKRLGQL